MFSPVLIWNAGHDWATFRFQSVRAIATHEVSLRTLGDFIGLQFGLVGFILLPVVLSGLMLTAWRGYRRGDAVAVLLSTSVIVPFGYFFWKSLSLRVGDTWPMFIWPAGFAAAAINVAMLAARRLCRPGWSGRPFAGPMRRSSPESPSSYGCSSIMSRPRGISSARTDPIGGEAGYRAGRGPGAGRIATDRRDLDRDQDYRTYSMLRWYFNGRVPVIQINERGRFQGFRDPGMDIDQRPYRPLCRARAGR